MLIHRTEVEWGIQEDQGSLAAPRESWHRGPGAGASSGCPLHCCDSGPATQSLWPSTFSPVNGDKISIYPQLLLWGLLSTFYVRGMVRNSSDTLQRIIPSLKFINTVKEGKSMLIQLLFVAGVSVQYLGWEHQRRVGCLKQNKTKNPKLW